MDYQDVQGNIDFDSIVEQQSGAINKTIIGGSVASGIDYLLTGGVYNLNVLGTFQLPSYIGYAAVTGLSIYTSDTVREYLSQYLNLDDDMFVPLESLAVGTSLTAFVIANSLINGDNIGINNIIVPMLLGIGSDMGADKIQNYM